MTVKSIRAETLEAALFAVTKDRAVTHGPAEQTFARIAGLWSVHAGVTLTAVDVAIMLNLLKCARAKGNPQHQDNWIDMAGYAACGAEIAGNGE